MCEDLEKKSESSYQQSMLDLEERKYKIELLRYEDDQRFFKKNFATIITCIISVVAIIVSCVQIHISDATRDREITISQFQKDREYNLAILQFITKNLDDIFGNDVSKRDRIKNTIIAFSPEIASQYFSRFEASSPPDKKLFWKNSQEAAVKASFLISYYGYHIDKDAFDKLRKVLSAQGYNIVESNFYKDNAPHWFSKESTIIYYDEQNLNFVNQLVLLIKAQTGITFSIVKSNAFKEIRGQEQRRIFIHYIPAK
ncbi:hypothetical protein SAMN04489760_111103 [Syntrophus gentianae]|uniref:Uncharacterized protein n=1 Tax=Syntrophus gentianae TaxID=43775 RepID=A0A1H7XS24_9BACT|nr:hypothetical protein [Syntrophus gentianae]SEM35779.1 hypothetical protein SAMN04489760_111103 [Syntrophus gentianae]